MNMLKVILASIMLAFASVAAADFTNDGDYEGVGSNNSASGSAQHCNTPSTGCLGGDGGGDAGPAADAGDSGPAADSGDSGDGDGDGEGEGQGDPT